MFGLAVGCTDWTAAHESSSLLLGSGVSLGGISCVDSVAGCACESIFTAESGPFDGFASKPKSKEKLLEVAGAAVKVLKNSSSPPFDCSAPVKPLKSEKSSLPPKSPNSSSLGCCAITWSYKNFKSCK